MPKHSGGTELFMDLKNNNITLGEVLKNNQAKKVLQNEFKEYFNSPLFSFAKKMSIQKLLQLAKGKVPDDKINKILNELKNI